MDLAAGRMRGIIIGKLQKRLGEGHMVYSTKAAISETLTTVPGLCVGRVWTGAAFGPEDRRLLPPLLSLSAGFTWIGRFIWGQRKRQ